MRIGGYADFYTLIVGQPTRWWIEHASQDDPERSFAIATMDEVIGGIGLIFGEDVHCLSAELGYWLAEPFAGNLAFVPHLILGNQ